MATKFDFQRMRAYQLATALYAEVLPAVRRTEWPERALADQLIRAASSIALNIAEGAGEFSPREKVRFYRMARRSAWECVAILDLLKDGRANRAPFIANQQDALNQISALLTATIKRRQSAITPTDDRTPIPNTFAKRAARLAK